VMIEHRQAVNTLLDVNRRFGVREDDRVFAVSSLAFDLSVWDVFGTLAAGGTVVLPAPAPQPDPSAWSERMAQCGVTIWNSAPPLLEMLVESQAPLPSTLRLALLSGDWIPVPLPDRVRRQVPAARVVSLGGATEGSIWSILYPIGTVEPSWRSIPYGRPMAGQRFHIVDAAGRPAPAGVVGELCIGGAGVAMGYLGRPELTAERFVPDLFAAEPGRRLYRTGDLGRFGPDGVIEFLGRRDQQVKVRGYRVELGEIEAALARHPAVREAVVLALGEPRGDRRLAAFVVLRPEALPESVEPETLRAFVARSLPEPMVPALLEVLESLPLTPNGKVDRRALAERPLTGLVQQRAAAYVAPRDAVEERLAGVWRDLLGVEKVGVHDSFFALGGHSLLATRLVAAVREAFGVEVPLRTLFERPALEDLALVIAEARVERADAGDVERLLAELEEISDEEAGRLLEAESSSGGDDS
jgi:acyl-coenzyme A synthetase/AMP-(fatty) acid ligase/acyl carrier protein